MSEEHDRLRDQLVGFFFEESCENLELMESALVEIDPAAPDPEQVHSIFRAIHSVKGASGSFGFHHISELAHVAETILDRVRAGARPLTRPIIDGLLQATDCIGIMLQDAQDSSAHLDEERLRRVEAALQAILAGGTGSEGFDVGGAPSPDTDPQSGSPACEDEVSDWLIAFAPGRHLLRTGSDPVRLIRGLEDLGELEVFVDISGLPGFDVLDPEDCHLRWDLRLQSTCSEADIREQFSRVEEDCDLSISRYGEEPGSCHLDDGAGPASIDREVPNAPSEEATEPPAQTLAPGANAPLAPANSIRVGTDEVDHLIDRVAELAATQSMLSEIGERFAMADLARLKNGLSQLQRNTRELQETAMKIGLPLRTAIGEATNRYLTFFLAGEEYAVDIHRVQEIRGWTRPTKLPSTPSYVHGVIDLRGAIIPIIDLRDRLGLEVVEVGGTTVVIVLRIEGSYHDGTIGIVVDAVSDVCNVREAARRPVPEFGAAAGSNFASSLASVGDKMIIILEVDQLLRDQQASEVGANDAEAASRA